MLVFSEQNLVFLAVPKTGTTAVEWALRPKADIIFGKNRKHTTGMRYRMKIAPFLEEAYGVKPKPFAVMRNPVEQIRSWFRYRQGVSEINSDRSTEGHARTGLERGVRVLWGRRGPRAGRHCLRLGPLHEQRPDGTGRHPDA